MALIHCNFYSMVLDLSCSMDVIIPEPAISRAGKLLEAEKRLYPTLYLLHGLSDDHTIWQRRTSIERYAANRGLAVVMPAVDRSMYADMAHGNRYWTFISEEVPALARNLFPLSPERKDNFVAGLSMGGYGAMKLALTYPGRFAAGASLSGAVDLSQIISVEGSAWKRELKNIFGKLKNTIGSSNDLFFLAEKVANSKWKKLPLYVWCGTEDPLYSGNQNFKAHLEKLALNLTYEEGPGDHEWAMWDLMIQRVLDWLPLKKSVKKTVTSKK